MIWHASIVETENGVVKLVGSFEDSTIIIRANGYEMYKKPVNLWRQQEILAEDILNQYGGKIRQCESKIPVLVKAGRVKV